MKNIIFMQDIDKNKSFAKYSISSWKQWAEKNNSEVFVMEDLLCSLVDMGIDWQRHYIIDMLENEGIEYDQILLVDSDSLVHPDCPNFFELTEHKYAGVHQEGNMDWICRSMEQFSIFVFDGFNIPFENYINSSFQIFNKSHKKFQQDFLTFYNENRDSIKWMQDKYQIGGEQTPLNLFLHKNNIDMKFLPYKFNMTGIHQKEILDDQFTFTKLGWVYQFNQPEFNVSPQELEFWIKKTYEHLYGIMK